MSDLLKHKAPAPALVLPEEPDPLKAWRVREPNGNAILRYIDALRSTCEKALEQLKISRRFQHELNMRLADQLGLIQRANLAERRATEAERDAERRFKLLQLHHADAMELWEALNSLSFECDGVSVTKAPSRETYNRTFYVMDRHREAYSEKARAQAQTVREEGR